LYKIISEAIRILNTLIQLILQSTATKHAGSAASGLLEYYVEEDREKFTVYLWVPNYLNVKSLDVRALDDRTLEILSGETGLIGRIVFRKKIQERALRIEPKNSSIKIVVKKKGRVFC